MKQILSKRTIILVLSCAILASFYLGWLEWIKMEHNVILAEEKKFPDNYHNAKDKVHMSACGTKSVHQISFSSEDDTQKVTQFYLSELSKQRRVLVDISTEQDKDTKSYFTKITGQDQVYRWVIFISNSNKKTYVSIRETFLDKDETYKRTLLSSNLHLMQP